MSTITLTGNVVADPELRYTQDGTPLLSFRVAENHRRFDKARNEWVDLRTDWHDVTIWRGKAETLAEALKKGDRVVIVGDLESREVEKDGSKRVYWRVQAREIGIVPKAKSSQPAVAHDPWSGSAVSSDEPPF
ncbi:single-strand DNA-binding protein [Micrococcales bacterium KH10]|nr:single-strand DNA-binding protein [Micrococcales bacterium KH10]